MGFVQRAFTAPGTGGAEAAAIQAQANAQTAIQQANARMSQMTQLSQADAPQPPKAPAAPSPFTPGARAKTAGTAKSLLGAAAAGSELASAGATGTRRQSVLG